MIQKRPITAERALDRMQTMCSRAEHSEGEVREKLRKLGLPQPDADAVVARLKRDRYVDDRRFARAFAHDKVSFAGWGRRKILVALINKRVDRDIIDEALDNIDMNEYTDRIDRVVQSKVAAHPDLLETYEGRMRLFRHLISRGYEPDLAKKAINNNNHNN